MKLKYLILLAVTGCVITLDQLTKHLVVQKFYLGQSIAVIEGYFNLTYVRNTGAAFGLLAQAPAQFRVPFFILVPIVALVGIILVFRSRIGDNDLKMAAALSLIVGGAIGNLVDRALYNYVVDFLDFHWRYRIHFPAFNVADMAICVGVGLLLLDMFRQELSKGVPRGAPRSV